MKVHWKHHSISNVTRETRSNIRAIYSQLFEASCTIFYFNSSMNIVFSEG